ncbi:MAG: ribulokinase [Cyclobacteriaceae bacterium]|nr:ribulokinase [Cyclobacteriaceae bacterium]
MKKSHYFVLGIDFGTDSVRTLVVDAGNGKELASDVFNYPRWASGKYNNPARNQFRQHPLDYIEGLETSVRNAVKLSGVDIRQIRGIGIDTTGSTPVAVDKNGTPLSLKDEFAEDPNAMFILWKDHTAVREAGEINQKASSWGGVDYTRYEGGVYSSEWFWAKILHIIREDERICDQAYSWVEHCDWIPALLTGNTDPLTLKRSRCAAGHKAMWHEEWQGLPGAKFLEFLDPKFRGIRGRLYRDTFTSDVPAGNLSREWAGRLGLHTDIQVAVGTFDAHSGALGGEVEEFTLSKVMGTSTCDMLVAPMEKFGDRLVSGICGQVDGSIIPGMIGLEAGQSAFGDIYAWFKDLLMWPVEQATGNMDQTLAGKVREELDKNLIQKLSEAAAAIPAAESGIIALDWMNGRRTPYANQSLKGVISGLNLGSDAPGIFKALVEATCFGSRKIIDRFLEEGIEIKNVMALGGVAKKSPFVMQVMADVLNMPIKVARSEQTPALGSAMLGAVAAGIHSSAETAQKAMGSGYDMEYFPDAENAAVYRQLYEKYNRLGEVFEQELKNEEE